MAPGPGPALLGRVAELGRLQAELAGAVEGRAGAVLLAGDAGIGKSRLAGELATAASAAGITVVVGRCLDTGPAPLPYLPFSEVLAGLPVSGRELLTDRPALRGLVPGSGPPPEDVAADRELDRLAVFDGVAGALRAAAAQAPVLVVLEDLHWADRSSRELLSYLLARLGSQRLLVLATYRSDDLHRRHPLRRTLAELVRLPAVRGWSWARSRRPTCWRWSGTTRPRWRVRCPRRPCTGSPIAAAAMRSSPRRWSRPVAPSSPRHSPTSC
ncbi:hypothetical protein PSA01_57960 [Pseudonocardia saturnea]|uniref:Orc1-like AAA ATPase domain-containing protein n=1 Tax=Pseudonocardia saturnea TaxID=33909 RepID=A0ABQ0S773_9PSEU|nr:hypothetical protein Pdca_59010 [Pseudonocardia autotrophica]GEC28767.1 hypothetical protein PSA01_57960 [Pseudonocardia saturnea]